MHFRRLVESGIGLWLGSGGSGEGFALSNDELSRIYRIGKEVAGDSVLVGANQPETHTPQHALEHAEIAIAAGVDIVNLYGPSSWHGFKPTDQEFSNYMDRVIGSLRQDLAISPNGLLGYCPSPQLIASICNRYPQISTVNLTGISGDAYLIDLQDALTRDVKIYVGVLGSMNALALGAFGLHDSLAEANILPRTYRRYADLLSLGQTQEAAKAYAELQRFAHAVAPWRGANPRWIKMAMRILHLPGGAGTVREPYLLPGEEDFERLTARLLSSGIAEITDYAREANIV